MSTSISVVKKVNRTAYLKVLIMFALTIGISLLPPFGSITPLGMKVLGIFVGVLYGWCVLDTVWVSIFALLAIGYTCSDIVSVFSAGFANQITLAALMTSVLGGALDSCKITDLICNWCLTRNFVKGRPWVLVITILMAGLFIGAFASSLAGTFLLWVVILNLADKCHYEKGCKEIAFLLGMVVIFPAAGSNSIPFQPGAIFFNGFLNQGIGSTVGYGDFLTFRIVILAITFTIVLLLAKYVWKLDLSRFNISDEMREELKSQHVTYEQKVGLAAVSAFFAFLLLPGVLPKSVPGVAFLSSMGIVGVSSAILIVLTIMRNKEGKSMINIVESHKYVPWNVIWLMVAVTPISDILKSESTGIMATITQYTMPLFQSIGLTAFMIGSTIALGLLTQVSVNMVLGAVFIPFLSSICVQLGGNPYTLFMMLYTAITMAYMTPAASTFGALMHGHDWIKGKNAYIIAAMNLTVILIVTCIIGIPLGELLF